MSSLLASTALSNTSGLYGIHPALQILQAYAIINIGENNGNNTDRSRIQIYFNQGVS